LTGSFYQQVPSLCVGINVLFFSPLLTNTIAKLSVGKTCYAIK
jgi:hypothetical protein